jgi:hypothetical protein
MERNLRFIIISSSFVLALTAGLTNCSSSKAYTILQEPTLDQIAAQSEEICLKQWLYLISRKPCILIQGEKDNTAGSVQYYLRYEIGTFDVDLPIGISLKLGGTWYNLKKSATNYSETITINSQLTPEVLTALASAQTIEISYTNRSRTENIVFSDSQASSLKEAFVKVQRLLESEKKMIILKK